MKPLIKKYTLLYLTKSTVDQVVKPVFTHGYSYVPTKFDTQDEAIAYAFEDDRYADFVVLPVYSFDN